MTIKELLKQYRSICKEIEEKNIKLKDCTVFGAVRGSDSEFPYTQHMIQVSGITHSKDNASLISRLKELEHQKTVVENFIDGIEDSLTRRIFEYRYIKGDTAPSWTKVAFYVGGGNTKDGVRMIHKRFLEEK